MNELILESMPAFNTELVHAFLGNDSTPLSDDHFHGNTHCDYGITANEQVQRSNITHRDRDILTEPPLEGGLVPNLARQASTEESNNAISLLKSVMATINEKDMAFDQQLEHEIAALRHDNEFHHQHGSEHDAIMDASHSLSDISDLVMMIRANDEVELQSLLSPRRATLPSWWNKTKYCLTVH